MFLALISSQEEGAPSDRQIRVVKDTLAPMITEGFIGVCCKSVQKVCNYVKDNLEKGRQEGTDRITKYDGKVQPDYGKYPHNAQICCG